ncbi:MAG: group 1 glycosyl transferase [Parcubacteria group bacterium Greene0416_36]|nr:MAG: group 1 glycosyl transferase [Parcubacteria group bacterium Greene0416_36]
MSAQRVDHFIANSDTVRGRIEKYYDRDSHVIYPPVQTGIFQITPKTDDYFLAGGRLVYYKRIDLVVKAFNTTGIKLKIFGDGPEREKLEKMARGNIEFVGKVDDSVKAQLFSGAKAYIHPQEEDFGISAVESMAAGRPVLALGQGGALESVIPGVTGELFYHQGWEEIADLSVRFDTQKYNPYRIREHAEKFSVERFKREIMEFVNNKYQEFNKKYDSQ